MKQWGGNFKNSSEVLNSCKLCAVTQDRDPKEILEAISERLQGIKASVGTVFRVFNCEPNCWAPGKWFDRNSWFPSQKASDKGKGAVLKNCLIYGDSQELREERDKVSLLSGDLSRAKSMAETLSETFKNSIEKLHALIEEHEEELASLREKNQSLTAECTTSIQTFIDHQFLWNKRNSNKRSARSKGNVFSTKRKSTS